MDSVFARPVGVGVEVEGVGDGEKRKSGFRQEKDEEDFRHDRRVINHKILQAVLVDLPALDGRDQSDGPD